MVAPGRRHPVGITRLEFAVVAVVFGLLVAGLMERMLFYNEQAERVAVQQLVGTLRTALQLRVTTIVSGGGKGGLSVLADENPMSWLSEKPKNYLGEFYSPNLNDLPQGNWLFDRTDHSLVYLPNSHKSFSIETSKFLRFKVKFVRTPGPGSDGRNKVTKGAVFDQVVGEGAVNTN